jgi:hypothetical protein
MASETIPDEAVLLPISLRGKLMGMVYVDHDGDQPWNLEAAQSLNAVACWLIDTLHHRNVVPTPMLEEIEMVEPTPAPEPEPAVPSDVFKAPEDLEEPAASESFEMPPEPAVAEPESFEMPSETSDEEPEILEFESAPEEAVEFEPETLEPEAPEPVVEAAPEPAEEEIAEIDYDFEPEPAPVEEPPAEAGFDPSATVRVEANEEIEVVEPAVEPELPPPPVETAFEAPPEPAPPAEAPEPPPIQPVEPPAEPLAPSAEGEDDARQEEARRFARLLVSEIKLYNEDEVERGRAERDLGERLKEDIERSREMYEKRIPAEVRAGRDYFQDELVRILADGDADAFGG